MRKSLVQISTRQAEAVTSGGGLAGGDRLVKGAPQVTAHCLLQAHSSLRLCGSLLGSQLQAKTWRLPLPTGFAGWQSLGTVREQTVA